MIKQVKIKIATLDPTGVEVENLEIPLIISEEGSTTCPHCNMTRTIEPRCKYRYLLEIGEYKYLIMKNGFLERIGHDEDGNNTK